jgi:hypothetical protein
VLQWGYHRKKSKFVIMPNENQETGLGAVPPKENPVARMLFFRRLISELEQGYLRGEMPSYGLAGGSGVSQQQPFDRDLAKAAEAASERPSFEAELTANLERWSLGQQMTQSLNRPPSVRGAGVEDSPTLPHFKEQGVDSPTLPNVKDQGADQPPVMLDRFSKEELAAIISDYADEIGDLITGEEANVVGASRVSSGVLNESPKLDDARRRTRDSLKRVSNGLSAPDTPITAFFKELDELQRDFKNLISAHGITEKPSEPVQQQLHDMESSIALDRFQRRDSGVLGGYDEPVPATPIESRSPSVYSKDSDRNPIQAVSEKPSQGAISEAQISETRVNKPEFPVATAIDQESPERGRRPLRPVRPSGFSLIPNVDDENRRMKIVADEAAQRIQRGRGVSVARETLTKKTQEEEGLRARSESLGLVSTLRKTASGFFKKK